MRRITTTLALAVFVLGCSSAPQKREYVSLLTGVDSCWAGAESSSGITGVLVPDPNSGTAVNGKPIMWPVGFTGRRLGAEVEVLDENGNVVAATGRTYHMSMGRVSGSSASTDIEGAFPAAANCGYEWDFMDCTLAPGSSPNFSYKLYCGFPDYWTCTTPAPGADPSDTYCQVRP